MAFNVGGNINIGKVELETAQPEPVARRLSDILAAQAAKQEEERIARELENKGKLPVDENRPIFNSIIDRKENSRYMLDLVKV